MVIRSGRFGKFLACSRYPECKTTQPVPTGVKCPEPGCKGDMVERRSRRGKNFYSCSRYPDCKYATWNYPVNHKCPACAFPLMTRNVTKTHGEHLRCPACGHRELTAEGALVEA
jgi:DNA topoisomerase-1